MSLHPPSWLYLASQSPRRAQLLDQLGVAHRPLVAAPHEDAESLEAELPGEPPLAYVQRVTRLKLQAAQERWRRAGLPAAPILCADTCVALGTDILGKPADVADARRALQRLSGRHHEVITAVALAWQGQEVFALSRSEVTWRTLSAREIEDYVASGEPMGKAGAYAIQSRAAAWTQEIRGSYTGIMGLPLFETDQLLRRIGFFD
jgi:septum formation protein